LERVERERGEVQGELERVRREREGASAQVQELKALHKGLNQDLAAALRRAEEVTAGARGH